MAPAKTLKVKKKRWIPILAPPLFNKIHIGEILVSEPEEAVGRDITVSLMVITGEPKRQSTHVSFKIDGFHDGFYNTSIKGLEILPSSVKRLVRRAKERVDDSFEVVSQDGKKIRIKPLMVTRNSTSRQVCSKLKAKSRDFLIRALARSPIDKFVLDLNSYKLQKDMSAAVSKIYPVSICEIRSFKIVGTGTPPVLPPEPVEQPKEPEEESDPGEEKPKKRSKKKKEDEPQPEQAPESPQEAAQEPVQESAKPKIV